jgi:hypothetical protein
VKPALKNTMSIFTHVSTSTSPFPEIRTWNAAIMKLSRIPSSSIFTRVNKWALGPIMGIGTGTRPYLERIHSEFISRIDAVLDIWERWINRIFFLL